MVGLTEEKAGGAGKLAENVLHFARILRAAGIANSTRTVLDALAALAFSGLRRRQDVYWTLRTVFTTRPDQQLIFDEAFKVFWRDVNFLTSAMPAMLPTTQLAPEMVRGDEISRRLAEALAANRPHSTDPSPKQQITYDAALTWSNREVLRNQDFEAMSAQEERQAIALVATLRMVIKPTVQRRMQPAKTSNHVDLRTTLRHMLRQGARHCAATLSRSCSATPAGHVDLRYFRINEPICADIPAFYACSDARCDGDALLRFRLAFDEYHPCPATARRR